jgi:hypothetical protein
MIMYFLQNYHKYYFNIFQIYESTRPIVKIAFKKIEE